MTLLLGAIGWGLLLVGGLTHAWHFDRLQQLLGRHFDRPLLPAAMLVGVELLLGVGIGAAVLGELPVRGPLAFGALVVGLVFAAWIGRLLATGSSLPCACSFSNAPTSVWSLLRAAAVCLVGLIMVAGAESAQDRLVALAVGLGVAASVFVLPEALTWPTAQRAQLARIDSHRPAERGGS